MSESCDLQKLIFYDIFMILWNLSFYKEKLWFLVADMKNEENKEYLMRWR